MFIICFFKIVNVQRCMEKVWVMFVSTHKHIRNMYTGKYSYMPKRTHAHTHARTHTHTHTHTERMREKMKEWERKRKRMRERMRENENERMNTYIYIHEYRYSKICPLKWHTVGTKITDLLAIDEQLELWVWELVFYIFMLLILHLLASWILFCVHNWCFALN